MLKDLRRNHRVKLDAVRTLRWSMRQEFPEAQYPLAEHAVYLNGRRLSHELRKAGVHGEAAYEPETKTVRWGPSMTVFLERLEWSDDVPIIYRPSLYDHPDVAIEPTRQFGATQVDGMRTTAVYELVRAGEPLDQIAKVWNKPRRLVRQAYEYELALRGDRAAA
jgi:hypothetical protein